jgi:hypothetical protein
MPKHARTEGAHRQTALPGRSGKVEKLYHPPKLADCLANKTAVRFGRIIRARWATIDFSISFLFAVHLLNLSRVVFLATIAEPEILNRMLPSRFKPSAFVAKHFVNIRRVNHEQNLVFVGRFIVFCDDLSIVG